MTTEGNILGVVEGNKVITFKCEEPQHWVIKNDIASCTSEEEISALDIFVLILVIAAFIISSLPIIKKY
jgi:hypothetical protein|nr:MAG TPA: hypothetical protein [Caudoviricetes sp.]